MKVGFSSGSSIVRLCPNVVLLKSSSRSSVLDLCAFIWRRSWRRFGLRGMCLVLGVVEGVMGLCGGRGRAA